MNKSNSQLLRGITLTNNLRSNLGFRFMVFNTTFKNIYVISWQSVLLMEETGVPGENHEVIYHQACTKYYRYKSCM